MMGSGLACGSGRSAGRCRTRPECLTRIAGYDPKDEMTVFSVGRKPPAAVCELCGRTASRWRAHRRAARVHAQNAAREGRRGEHRRCRTGDRGPARAGRDDCRSWRRGRAVHAVSCSVRAGAAELRVRATVPAAVSGGGPDAQVAIRSRRCCSCSRTRRASRRQLSLRTLNAGGFGPAGEGKYMINRYLRERGDANIKSNADLIAKARFYQDPNFPDRKQAREQAERATVLDTSARLQGRFAVQTMLLQCMQEQRLDALVSPMSTVPPRKLTSPREPALNGRTPIGCSLIGQQGFPVITVPAGFTTTVWDRVAEAAAHALSDRSRRPCRWASISSPGRSMSRCCSGSHRPMKPRRSIASRRPISDRCRRRGLKTRLTRYPLSSVNDRRAARGPR